jgi:hypothetical protein
MSVKDRVLDENAKRFLFSERYRRELSKRAPDAAALRFASLRFDSMVWAMHSETQEAILDAIAPEERGGELNWEFFAQSGIPLWMTSVSALSLTLIDLDWPSAEEWTERLSRAIFKRTEAPMDAALYLLILQKKIAVAQFSYN